MRARSMIALALTMFAAILATAPLASAKATDIHTAALTGSAAFPAVNGSATFKVDDGVRRLEVEIQDANRLKGARLNVIVAGTRVASMVVDSLGNATLRAAGAAVPVVTTGTRIAVRRASNGTLVASGTFG